MHLFVFSLLRPAESCAQTWRPQKGIPAAMLDRGLAPTTRTAGSSSRPPCVCFCSPIQCLVAVAVAVARAPFPPWHVRMGSAVGQNRGGGLPG
uniref:Secreted protein n=1 Tax=Arundo donax TaxID=35708 RepID=A0A0A9HW26_ARUDO